MEENTNKSKMKFGWSILVVLTVVLSLGAAVYFWNDARQAKQETPDAVAAKNLKETERVVNELSKILLLNADQDPTVARVEDPSVLQQSNPDFYKDIQVGDYLVLYPQRAIVYRSSETKIINIAPIVNTEQLQQSNEDQSTQTPTE